MSEARLVLHAAVVFAFSISGCESEPAKPTWTVQNLPTTENSLGMKFVEIPAGEFLMGAIPGDDLAEEDEQPQHRVRITKSFWLGQYEVTQSQYEAVMDNNPSWFGPQGRGAAEIAEEETANWPVDSVSWNDANLFCQVLSERPEEIAAGRSYRLPTEAEWEYACRAGTETRFSFGSEVDHRFANYKGAVGHPLPVGSYPPNPFGLYDMHGNVLEWCQDLHADDYYGNSPLEDPTGPESSDEEMRVLRGGGWGFQAASSSFRDRISAYLKGGGHGFRVVMMRSDEHSVSGNQQVSNADSE